MADMTGKVRAEFDAAAGVTLRNATDGAETGADTDAEAGVALNTLVNAYWDNNEVPNGLLKFNLLVTAGAFGVNSNAYTVIFEVDTENGFGSPVEVARIVVPRTGYYDLYVASKVIEALEPGAKYLRVKVTKTTSGGSPSITYACWATFGGMPA